MSNQSEAVETGASSGTGRGWGEVQESSLNSQRKGVGFSV
jgi:hypothetical protein